MFDVSFVVFLLAATFGLLDGVFTFVVLRRGGIELNPTISLLTGKIGLLRTVLLSRVATLMVLSVFWVLGEPLLLASGLVLTAFAAVFTIRSVC